MRDLVALVFNYSVNGLLAAEGTDFWTFCFGLLDESGGPDDDAETLDFLRSAHAHLMGRTAYEGMSVGLREGSDHPWAPILREGRKFVFSHTLEKADWANTTIVSGDVAEAIENLRQGGDGHIIVWGGVAFWRSLMHLDLIDEFEISMYPYIANTGTRLFEDVPTGYSLELTKNAASPRGVINLRYRRRR